MMSEFEDRLWSHRAETIKALRVPHFITGAVTNRKVCTTRMRKTVIRKVSRAHRLALVFESVISDCRNVMREVGKANRLEDQACEDFCATIDRLTERDSKPMED